MTTEHLIDPELLPSLALYPPFTMTAEVLPEVRAGFMQMIADLSVIPNADTSVETILVPSPAGAPPVRVLVYHPPNKGGPLPAIFHIHGGGYVIGAPEMMDVPHRVFAKEMGCVIVSVDYRLAPESPHPGPVEDCYAALQWLHDNAEFLGVDPTRIGVKGESAGGGLAAALALLARDRDGPKLAFQHLIYPMLDDRTCVDSDPHPFVGEFVWTPSANAFGWSSLLGVPAGSENVSPYASPARAEDLAGLPPTFIAVGSLDLFLEENIEYARRLSRVGVPIELHVYPGAFHGFHQTQNARVTQDAERDSRESLRRSLEGGPKSG